MEQRIRKHPRITNESHLTDFVDFNQGPMQLLQQGVNICVGDQIDERVIRHGARPTARVKKEPVDFMGGGEVEVNPFPASSYQPTINLNYPLISQPGPSTSPYQYHLGSPGAQYNMQQYAPSPEAKYNPTPSPQYNIAGSPPYPPIDSTYQPSVQFNINPGGQPQSESQNIDLGSLPSLSDSNLQVLEQFINVDNLSTSFSQNLSFTTEDEKKNNFDNASSSNKEQVSNDLDKGGSNVFRISAKDVPSGFSGLLSDDMSATENYLRNDVNMKSFNQLSSKE